jgi:hypothetical protein
VADFFSILSTSYKNAPVPTSPSSPKYVPVNPDQYNGIWKGTYSTGEKFSFQISDVQGFRAKVKYQSDKGPVLFQDVLIKDNSFRIGDSKFLMKKIGHAQIKTVVTNPATGGTVLNTAYADRV